MPFGYQRSDFFIPVNILHDLMESRGYDGIAKNPWSSQQLIIQSVGVKNIARYLGSQVPNLVFEFDLSHQAFAIGIEAINGSLSGAQSTSENSQVLHDPAGHDAQRGPQIHLNTAHLR